MTDKLKSGQDKICSWLSADPDHILKQCGEILSMNEFLEVQQQSSALDKTRVLLKIIIQKGGESCQTFFEILRQNQAHYQQLQQLFHPNTEESPTATVVADGSSVVTAREITNTRATSLNMKIETVRDPGCGPSGNVGGLVPQADYTAQDGSVICADKISGVTIDGAIDLSVTIKPSAAHAGTVTETAPASQGPAVKMIIEHKVELIDCLRADHSFILQHVHAKHIVTDREYQSIKHVSQPEKTVSNLIDQVIGKGQQSCSLFLEVLKQPDVVQTYPQLKHITKKWC
ncbi:uncharacterized protein [Pempheris klunzingeri]|uniref:uncharacterized protein n=1 Tax=Pempheris klunzingeri TaxID=3127111 RepID=UPI00397F7018